MVDRLRFVPAASLPLAELADLFTRSFEDYFYPGVTTVAQLTTRARVEQLDLSHSVVMLLDGEPAGQALLGLRGERAWCGGFGIVKPMRGRRLAQPLGEALLEQARLAGATHFQLEVLTRNSAAIQTYRRLGLSIVRDLQIFEWATGEGAGQPRRAAPDKSVFGVLPARDLLDHFTTTHPVAAAWQRDLPALLVRSGLQSLSSTNQSGQLAYVLYSVRDTGARIEDLGAQRVEDALRLLQELQARYTRLSCVNEPADSPNAEAYSGCGFREVDRQHEMVIQL